MVKQGVLVTRPSVHNVCILFIVVGYLLTLGMFVKC